MEEKRGSAEGRVNAPLPGLGQRPVSEAHAVELELEVEVEVDLKNSKFEIKKIAYRFQIYTTTPIDPRAMKIAPNSLRVPATSPFTLCVALVARLRRSFITDLSQTRLKSLHSAPP